jgi:hypothetical protein
MEAINQENIIWKNIMGNGKKNETKRKCAISWLKQCKKKQIVKLLSSSPKKL